MRFCKLTLVMLLFLALSNSCENSEIDPEYRDHMREFVKNLSSWSKQTDPDFIIIPQNGPELVTLNGEEDGKADIDYLAAIDAVGREDLYFGYRRDNQKTPEKESEYMISFLDICENNHVEVLTTDYCSDKDKIDNSYAENHRKEYISFAAPDRELDRIPSYPLVPYNENSGDILKISDAKNFLYLINPGKFNTKPDFLSALENTNYDLIIIDLFFNENQELSETDINQIKLKKNGGSRLIIAYMSIGEAEDYRYYWNNSWKKGDPSWIEKENPDWEGNYKVRYWEKDWQDIIFGNQDSYLQKILNAGFDGVYLDIIDAFEYFE